MGIVDTRHRMALTANAALARDEMLPGRLMLLSQSGSLLGTFVSRGGARSIGFASLVSVGNEADLGVGEIGAAAAGDPGIDAFLLFLETIRRPEEIARFAALAHAAGKPILAYKLGRSAIGRDLAVSHTGALVGSDAAADAFLAHHGIVRVDQFEALLELPPLLIGRRPLREEKPAVGVVTTTGGGAAMVVDRLGLAEVPVAEPSEATLARLAARGIHALPGRILDLTLAGTRPDVMAAALETLLEAPEFAAVIAVVGSSAQFQPELAVKPIIDCAHRAKPLAAFIAPQADTTLGLLAEAGVAAFRTPEACADGIRALLAWRAPRAPEPLARLPAAPVGPGTVLDERLSQHLFQALGVPCAPSVVLNPDDLPPGDLPFPYPVVAKILCPDILHKSEVGGVLLDITSAEALRDKATAMVATLRDRVPEARLAGLLVQPMLRGLAEALVGFTRDAQVGPIVTVGMGGVLAELYRDVAVRLAPVSRIEAAAMIEEVRGLASIRGFRNLPRGDVAALAEAVARFSQLAALEAPRVAEAEINPLIVMANGVVAVDGLVRFE
ncbi:MAG: acetate--CoA ligase family protein [Alphaproteobacteria bacterium]|nr:acetate--CoA ligase family protein [Alphaproteobacteria bacterium]